MKPTKIARILRELESRGVIKSGNYNKVKWDRTKWYTIIDQWVLDFYNFSHSLHNQKQDKPLLKNVGSHSTKINNGESKNEQPIPDINTDIITDIKPDIYIPEEKQSYELHPLFNVPINQTTYKKLCVDYGQDTADDYIERVKNYVETKGLKKYKDYSAAAHNWIKKDKVEKKERKIVRVSRDCPVCDNHLFEELENMTCGVCGWGATMTKKQEEEIRKTFVPVSVEEAVEILKKTRSNFGRSRDNLSDRVHNQEGHNQGNPWD
jgi:hypothetical protein